MLGGGQEGVKGFGGEVGSEGVREGEKEKEPPKNIPWVEKYRPKVKW